MEIWKDIPGYEGLYQASNFGNIKSLARYTKNYTCNNDKLLKQFKKKGNDYYYVCLKNNGVLKQVSVHRLILKTFKGNSNLQCNHKNCIKTDNKIENLEWVTPQENVLHAKQHGLLNPPRGEERSDSKLTNKDVIKIKSLVGKVERGYWRKLSKEIGVSEFTIYNVIQNKTWNHIKI